MSLSGCPLLLPHSYCLPKLPYRCRGGSCRTLAAESTLNSQTWLPGRSGKPGGAPTRHVSKIHMNQGSRRRLCSARYSIIIYPTCVDGLSASGTEPRHSAHWLFHLRPWLPGADTAWRAPNLEVEFSCSKIIKAWPGRVRKESIIVVEMEHLDSRNAEAAEACGLGVDEEGPSLPAEVPYY